MIQFFVVLWIASVLNMFDSTTILPFSGQNKRERFSPKSLKMAGFLRFTHRTPDSITPCFD